LDNILNKLSVLLIEDQLDIANNIIEYFELRGITVDYANNGELGLELCLKYHFDVIILDIMMPGLNGLDTCLAIREQSNRYIPIIMLTARDAISDKVTGFEVGADDYLTKPFALAELEVRCMALSRRHQLNQQKIANVGELEIDFGKNEIWRNKIKLNVNATHFKILSVLIRAHPKVVSRSELCFKIWGDDLTESDSLRSHIYQLRQIVDKPFSYPMLKTVHAVGFCLVTHKD